MDGQYVMIIHPYPAAASRNFWSTLYDYAIMNFIMTESETLTITPEEAAIERARVRRQRWIIFALVAIVLLLLGGIVAAVYALTTNPGTAADVRDIFIIFLAFETLVIGAAMVILVLQIASLINLLQNEVKPILQSTTDTVNTLRGTTEFLSENLVEPVIKLNSSIAGLRRFFELFGFKQK